MDILELSTSQLSLLADRFDEDKYYIKESLELIEVPPLECESYALSITDAKREFYEGDCCSDEQKAALRKWIEIATTEEEVREAFDWSCDDSEVERQLAVRKMAKIMFKLSLN